MARDWLDLFNMVTLPFYLRGLRTPAWTSANRAAAAHRPVVQGSRCPRQGSSAPVAHSSPRPGYSTSTTKNVESAIRVRIADLVTGFAGTIDLWDAINEAVILPVFKAERNAVTRLAQSKGRLGMVRMAFEAAREANPSARLVINDFDLSADYERLLAECLDDAVAIDAIGLQTHMHQGYRGEDRIREVLDRFSRFGLPLQLTETTLLSGDLMPKDIVDLNDFQVDAWPSTPEGEARQAEEIVRHYRSVVAHPAVESLTYWGITDRGAWLGAPSGLLRSDGSRKPGFDALRGLIKGEWWYPATELVADEHGIVEVDGFAGEYRVGASIVRLDARQQSRETVDVVLHPDR